MKRTFQEGTIEDLAQIDSGFQGFGDSVSLVSAPVMLLGIGHENGVRIFNFGDIVVQGIGIDYILEVDISQLLLSMGVSFVEDISDQMKPSIKLVQ